MIELDDEDLEGTQGINITPLVDVSLVLVLIFMVTMPLSMLHGIEVKRQLLQRYGLTTPQDNISIHLTETGVRVADEKGAEQPIAYDEVGMVLSQMIQLARSKKDMLPQVFLKVEKPVPHGQTVWILDIAKQNGAGDISLLETE